MQIGEKKEYLPNKGMKETHTMETKKKSSSIYETFKSRYALPHQNLDSLKNQAKIYNICVLGRELCNPLQTFYNSIKYFNPSL